VMAVVAAVTVAAQERGGGQRAGGPGRAGHDDDGCRVCRRRTVPGQVQPGRGGGGAWRGHVSGESHGRTPPLASVVLPAHARPRVWRAIGRPTTNRTGCSGTFRRLRPDCRKACPKGNPRPRWQFSRSAPRVRCIEAPALRRPGPMPPLRVRALCRSIQSWTCSRPPMHSRRAPNVLKAIQGHILAKAVYGGLFRRPQ
jgi:hypothetical protein